MGKYGKLLQKILQGASDANISFDDLCRLLRRHGFEERTRGSHHIFAKTGVNTQIVLQPRGGKAQPYQVKQVRELFKEYNLGGKNEE
jgi:predicted RNA binding protein YcfA (HicA-like mRNA interferase family)